MYTLKVFDAARIVWSMFVFKDEESDNVFIVVLADEKSDNIFMVGIIWLGIVVDGH